MAFFFDPGLLPPVSCVEKERTFTIKGGSEITLAFRVQAGGDITLERQAMAGQYLERYEHKGVAAGGPRDAKVKVSWPLCYAIARLTSSQVKPKGAPHDWVPLLFEHWAVLAQRDYDTFSAILTFLNELDAEASPDPKNDLTADDAPSSPPPSTPGTDTPT
jgi:hypothetical protein